jgi:hypothetical protein
MSEKNEISSLAAAVHPAAPGFAERVTPKPPDEVFFFACPRCQGIHFRHAGYVHSMLPFLKPQGEKHVAVEAHQVMVCVKCRSASVRIGEQTYDVTDRVDLEAWEKFEKEAHKATGPGGNC